METQVIFISQQQFFCLPIGQVEKIIQVSAVTPVPKRASFVLGVIDYGDGVLPLIDLSGRLYNTLTTINEHSKIIVVQSETQLVGLLVEEVQGIKHYQTDQFVVSADPSLQENSFISNFVRDQQEIIIALDLAQLLATDLSLAELVSPEFLEEILADTPSEELLD